MQYKKFVIILAVGLLSFGLILALLQAFAPRFRSRSSVSEPDRRPEQIQNMRRTIRERAKTDADLDGLSNEREKELGTNPNLSDTDADGVLDYDEVERFKTDPLKKDTDGDGVSDGDELRRGSDPKKK